jgi:uncharacterized protein YndB with AHSA1/START domain
MQEALVVHRETLVPAPPAAVFALLTDSEKILRWMRTDAQFERLQYARRDLVTKFRPYSMCEEVERL